MEIFATAIVFAIAMIACARPEAAILGSRLLRVAGRRSALCAAIVIAAALLLYILPSVRRVPVPVVHDEFAYLLQGDTFLHGRLANPPLRDSKFFETFHVLQSPTYGAKFPPGNGLFLAVGEAAGLPLIGVWISLLLAALFTLWMLRAVMPMRWALLGMLLTAVHPTTLWYAQTYWGGGTSMLAGAMLGGAVLRAAYRREMTASNGLIGGFGAALLAITRPFEALMICIGFAIILLVIARRRRLFHPFLKRFAPMAMIPLLIGGCWTLYDDWRVTGHPLLMPYALHTQRYMSVPIFYWQPMPPTPDYAIDEMRKFHTGAERDEYLLRISSVSGWMFGTLDGFGMIVWAYARSILLLIPIVAAIICRRTRRVAIMAVAFMLAVLILHLAMTPWMRVAYLAGLTGVLAIPLALGLRQISRFRLKGQPIGAVLAAAILVTQLFMGVFVLGREVRSNQLNAMSRRQMVLSNLTHSGGRHVVFVRYSPNHNPGEEWVYNSADPESQAIIFARDLGADEDRTFLADYPGRTGWQVEVGDGHDTDLILLPLSGN